MCNIWLPVISWADLFYHTVENLASCSSGFSLQQVITRFLSLPLCFTETVLHGNRRRWALRRRYSPCLRLRGRRLHSRLRRMLQWLRRQRWPRLPKHPRTEIQNPSRCLHKVMNNGAQEEWCLRLTVQEAEWLGCPWTWMTKTERAGGDRVMPCFAFFFVSFFFCLYFSCCFLVKKSLLHWKLCWWNLLYILCGLNWVSFAYRFLFFSIDPPVSFMVGWFCRFIMVAVQIHTVKGCGVFYQLVTDFGYFGY